MVSGRCLLFNTSNNDSILNQTILAREHVSVAWVNLPLACALPWMFKDVIHLYRSTRALGVDYVIKSESKLHLMSVTLY